MGTRLITRHIEEARFAVIKAMLNPERPVSNHVENHSVSRKVVHDAKELALLINSELRKLTLFRNSLGRSLMLSNLTSRLRDIRELMYSLVTHTH
jgi:hypothetical protein